MMSGKLPSGKSPPVNSSPSELSLISLCFIYNFMNFILKKGCNIYKKHIFIDACIYTVFILLIVFHAHTSFSYK